jgi:hypothetical protein
MEARNNIALLISNSCPIVEKYKAATRFVSGSGEINKVITPTY